MSGGSSLDVKEQVRQATDIVELIGSFLPLRRQGRQYVGLCPWHDDSKPSLTVSADRQSYRCWVCNLGGDVFSFVMQMEGIDFREALEMLAERANIPLRPERPKPASPGAADASFDKQTLYRITAWAEKHYHKCLLDLPEGEPGRRYFADRKISAESIAKFNLGFCPDQWDWILRRAQPNGPSEKMLEAVGILARSAGTGSAYDRFKGRVMFPIHDPQGRAIAFGGRILPEAAATSPAKYVNSPETTLFHKSDQLYGLDAAKEGIRRAKQVMVMEGYTDCIMAQQFGFLDAVAVLGTALGEGHVRILKRFADKILLVLDGDEAGQRRANEVLELFVAQQVDLKIVTLPEQLDPCDFLLEHGAEAFSQLLSTRAVDALDHAFLAATRGVDLERDIHGSTQAMEKVLRVLAKAPPGRADAPQEFRLREEKILQRMATRFRVDEREIRKRLTELRRGTRPSPAPAVLRTRDRTPDKPDEAATVEGNAVEANVDSFECGLLETLMAHPDLLPRIRASIRPEQITSAACRRIYVTMRRLADDGQSPTFERLMLEFEEPALKGLLVQLDEQAREKAGRVDDPTTMLEHLLQSFETRDFEKRRPSQVVALREGNLDPEQQTQELQKILDELRARQGRPRPTDG